MSKILQLQELHHAKQYPLNLNRDNIRLFSPQTQKAALG